MLIIFFVGAKIYELKNFHWFNTETRQLTRRWTVMQTGIEAEEWVAKCVSTPLKPNYHGLGNICCFLLGGIIFIRSTTNCQDFLVGNEQKRVFKYVILHPSLQSKSVKQQACRRADKQHSTQQILSNKVRMLSSQNTFFVIANPWKKARCRRWSPRPKSDRDRWKILHEFALSVFFSFLLSFFLHIIIVMIDHWKRESTTHCVEVCRAGGRWGWGLVTDSRLLARSLFGSWIYLDIIPWASFGFFVRCQGPIWIFPPL